MLLQQVNALALQTAAVAVVGPMKSDMIGALYLLIDKAMKDGYELGRIDGEAKGELLQDDAFDEGFDQGVSLMEEATCDLSFDEGYLEGVSDARVRPAIADETVVSIINDMMQNAINGEYDAAMVEGWDDEQLQDEA